MQRDAAVLIGGGNSPVFVGRFSYSLDFTFWKSDMSRYIILMGTFYYTRSKTHSCFRRIMASFMDEIYVSKNIQPSLPICYNNQVGISSFSSFVLVPTAHLRFMTNKPFVDYS